jgi:hypothetical protein
LPGGGALTLVVEVVLELDPDPQAVRTAAKVQATMVAVSLN